MATIGTDCGVAHALKYSYPVTPAELSSPILELCQRLVPDGRKPVYVDNRPSATARARECFPNVSAEMADAGGSSITGWAIWEFPTLFIEAEFHAIWRSPEGTLLDVTPRSHPTEKILFLEDPGAAYLNKQVNNVRKVLTADADVAVYLRTFDDLFDLLNRGDRASVVGELVMEGQDVIEFERLEAIQHQAWFQISQHLPLVTAYGPCWCGSGKKVRWCHGRQ